MEIELYRQIYENEKTHWWYVVRRLLVHKIIAAYCPKTPLNMLDIGCGAGLLTKELEKYGEVTGIDASPEAVKFAKLRGVDVIESSIENFENNGKFDCALALDILEHCENDELAIKKLRDFLKPDGVIIVFVPALKIFWGEQDEISHHFRRYAYQELKNKFENAGFKTVYQSYFNFFLAPLILAARKTMRLFNIKTGTEFKLNNPFLNAVFKSIFTLEYFLLPKIKFPFGVSLLGVYKKIP
ncbi:MAG: class I SAM-dependent methyltransferase [Patescibacteria group bacterium]